MTDDYAVSDRGGLPWYEGHLGPTLGQSGREIRWRADRMADQLWLVCHRPIEPDVIAYADAEFLADAGLCAEELTDIAEQLDYALPVEAMLLGSLHQSPAEDIARRATTVPVRLDDEAYLGLEWQYDGGAMFTVSIGNAWVSGLVSPVEPDHTWQLSR